MSTEKLTGTTDKRFQNKGWRKLLEVIAKATLVEEEETDEEKIQFRRDTCFECPNRNKEKGICEVCKCILQVKTASKINTNIKTGKSEVTHCPLGKWNDKDIADYYASLN